MPFIESVEYADAADTVSFTTPPDASIAQDLRPELVAGQHGVSVTIPSSLTCIKS